MRFRVAIALTAFMACWPRLASAGPPSVGTVEDCEAVKQGEYKVTIHYPKGAVLNGVTYTGNIGINVSVDSPDPKYCSKLKKGTKVRVTYPKGDPVVSPVK